MKFKGKEEARRAGERLSGRTTHSHMRSNVVRGPVVVVVCEFIDGADRGDYLSNGVDNRQPHNCPVFGRGKRPRVSPTFPSPTHLLLSVITCGSPVLDRPK